MHEIGNNAINMDTAKARQTTSNIHTRNARHKNNEAISIGRIGRPIGKDMRGTSDKLE